MKPEHRKGEIPDAVTLKLEELVEVIFKNIPEREKGIPDRRAMHFVEREFRMMLREALHEKMRKRHGRKH